MKKLFVFIACLTFSFSVFAQKHEEIKASELPKNTTSWISQNLKKSTMEKAVKIMDDKTLLGYCAVLTTDGRKAVYVFDKKGNYLDRVKKVEEVQRLLKPVQPAQPSQPAKK